MRLFTLALLAAGLTAGAASAGPIVNPGFETGNFTGWSTIGSTSVAGPFFTLPPPQGSFQAVLRTALVDGSNNADPAVATAAALATFLGVTTAQLDALAPNGEPVGFRVNSGSAIRQTFTVGSTNFTVAFGVVNQGDDRLPSALLVDDLTLSPDGTLGFRWNFVTRELDQGTRYNDFAFVSLNGQLVLLRDRNGMLPFPGTAPLNYVPGPVTTPANIFFGNTGTQTFSQNFPQLAIPEPATLAVFGGLALAGAVGYRRRKQPA